VAEGTTAVLSEDKKSVVLTFPASLNKTSFDLNVKNIKTEDKKATVTEFTGVVTVNDTIAPTVAKSEFKTNGDLEITFSEPLKTDVIPVVRIDGKPVTGTVSGSKVVVTVAALTSGGITVNNGQSISVYVANVKDTVGNEAALYNGTVTKVSDTVKPTITSITQVGQNKLKVVFSEALGAAASDLGANDFKFLNGSTVCKSTAADLDTTDTTNKTYIVTFNESEIYGATPVDFQTVTLILDKDDVKDAAGNGIDAYSQAFTFNTDKTAPKFVSSAVASDKETFELTFDEAFQSGTTNVDESKIIVTDANGVRYAVQDATTDVKVGTGNEKVLVVDFIPATADSQIIANGTYTVALQSGAVKDAKNNNNAIATTTLTVGDAVDTEKPVTILDADESTRNKFVVNFGEEVTSSALQLSNYKLDGKALPAGTVIYFNSAAKNSVTIELPNSSQNIGAVGTGTSAILNVANVADKAGNVADAKNFTVSVADNTSATLQNVQVLGNDIILTFNEAIDATTAVAINTPELLADQFEIKVDGQLLNLGKVDTGLATDATSPAASASLVSGNAKQVKISLTPAADGTGTAVGDGVASNWNNAKPVTVKVKAGTLKDANLFPLADGIAVSK
jgi:hypothetical protein